MTNAKPFAIKNSIAFAPGEKIATDGVYDIPIEAYHSDCCVGPSISSSGLRIFANRDLTPAHYWHTSYLNPKCEKPEESDHFTLGQAAHMLLLGEEGFAKKFVERLEQAPDGTAWNANKTICKEWLAEAALAGLKVLKPGDIKTIRKMADSLANDHWVQTGILSGDVEKSLIWKDPETGVWLKARPDALPRNADIVGDLKTTADASDWAISKALNDYGYHIQLALVGEGIKHVMRRDMFNQDGGFALVFVEKTGPCLVNSKLLTPGALERGRILLRHAIRKFASCWEKQDFHGYETSGGYIEEPRYEIDRVEKDIKIGQLQTVE